MQEISKPIENPDQLESLANRLRRSSVIGIDTEFTRVRTYLPQLELVQFAIDDLLFCVDTRSCGTLSPITDAIRTFDGPVVIHSAYQDMEVLHEWNALPDTVFDTQIAAEFCGYGTLSYAKLCHCIFDKVVGDSKNHDHGIKYSKWNRRPLTEQQIMYALDDVRHLLPLYKHLNQLLDSRGCQEWLREDCERLRSKFITSLNEDAVWKRFSRAGTLQLADQYRVRELLLWRERRARSIDKPRQWIIKDDAIVRIVENKPQCQRSLAGQIGLRYDGPRSWLNELLAIIHCKRNLSSKTPLWHEAKRLSSQEKRLFQKIKQQVNSVAIAADIPPELLFTSQDCKAMAKGYANNQKLSGWRGQLLNDIFQSISPEYTCQSG